MVANRFSSVTFGRRSTLSSSRAAIARSSARLRACFSFSTTLNSNPACGTPFMPRILTATEGGASLSRLSSSLISARTLP